MSEPETPNGTNTTAPETAPEAGATAPGTNGNGGPDPRVQELETLLVHLKADFDNYKKRTQKESLASTRSGELEAVRRFLPALSNLERALHAASAETGPLAEGLRQVYGQFQQILQGMGVERIPAVGQPFDPLLHDAVAAAPSPDVIPGTVIDEYEPGYRADGKALIPAKVRVATAE